MDNSQFLQIVEDANSRSLQMLAMKEKEYSEGIDRLDQFKKVAVLNHEPSTRSLWGMAVKHVSAVADKCKNPTSYNMENWREKLDDIRNYMYLLEALLIDLGIESVA